MGKILWIEDDARELRSLLWPLEDDGYEIDVAVDAMQARELVYKNIYDIIILDILLPSGEKDLLTYEEFTGVKVAEDIRKKGINTPMIALTVVKDKEIENTLKELNVLKIISKGSVLPSQLSKDIKTIIGDNK
jgi:DNA-binding response OmpR family regulator